MTTLMAEEAPRYGVVGVVFSLGLVELGVAAGVGDGKGSLLPKFKLLTSD